MYKSHRFKPKCLESDLERREEEGHSDGGSFSLADALIKAMPRGSGGADSFNSRKWVHKGSAWSKHGKHRHVNIIAIEKNRGSKPHIPFEPVDLKNIGRRKRHGEKKS